MKYIKILLILFIIIILIGCGKTYKITYDLNGGVMPEEYKDTFKFKEDYELPIPTKEGYLFLGWKEKDFFIDKLNSNNYTLKAEWIEKTDYNYIEDNQIFNQKYEEYLIYIMRNGCSWCDKIKDDVLRYQEKVKLEQYNKNIKIYVVNLMSNNKKSKIFRSYNEEGGDGDNFFVSNVTNWDQLYIPSTPTLIKVVNENNVRKTELLARGATKIKNTLRSYLIDTTDYSECLKTYEISYELNGGSFNEEYIKSFYVSNNVTLPIPQKIGFSFVGWYENDTLVKNIENKNYYLEAKWEETLDTKYVVKDKIFDMDKDYYVLFLKSVDQLYNYINEINMYNTFANVHNLPYIYIIDLNDCEEIYRTYDGENKYFVDGATSWDELYINSRYTLIYLYGEGNKEAKYVTFGKDEVLQVVKNNYNILNK